ncbi:hypothetical protein ABO04_11525 [Nitrosomonas sp. HPC101]|nr:hypothetical protein [Nitrosomonas sp. HPC101]
MLNNGGRSLEAMRTLKSDAALSNLLKLGVLPSTDAVGVLRTGGAGKGLAGFSRINRRIVCHTVRQSGITAYTLDNGASRTAWIAAMDYAMAHGKQWSMLKAFV